MAIRTQEGKGLEEFRQGGCRLVPPAAPSSHPPSPLIQRDPPGMDRRVGDRGWSG